MARLLVLAAVALVLVPSMAGRAPRDAKECEVCIKVLEEVEASIKDNEHSDIDVIETRIDKFCARKDLDPKQKKACYYITPIKREVSRPFSMGMPPRDICFRKLRSKNTELCEMRFPANVEVGSTDYNELTIKELKNILAERGVACKGCLEKSDFVRRCKESEKKVEL